ncbi:hypothetical protein DFR29_101151 [Tahibacter aquaticus]|uniref:Big-1 domain-containing protein n=1 Tax=Tahibacter aquaticus TaxID=520092 RepID=A0A4R6Z9E8_9GAMM|nr:hypothetical protein [Tahibacter aquaticus]TDR48531.1 hypothetical protein DFR29_101151 [Tahibacter aquaticus]
MNTVRVSAPFLSSFSRISLRRMTLALAAGIGFSCAAQAGFLTVPNGDFSAPANAGTVGGGVLGGSGTNVLIGSGPWTATYNGVLGLLAPPVLEISSASGTGSITGLLGINALGIVNNGGHFGQTLSNTWQSNKRYTVLAHLNTGAELDLPLLAAAGTGISLHAAGSLVASSTGIATHVRADAVDITTLRIALTHDTAVVAPGVAIGLQLFDRPSGLLTASLVDTAEYSAIRMAESTIPPAGSTLSISGGGSQSGAVGMPYPSAMKAIVRDQDGNPIPDVLVTLTAPQDGASANLFASGGESGRTIVTFTDGNGEVTLSGTANEISGCFRVNADVVGVSGQASFQLRNYSEAQIAAYMNANPGAMGTPQDSVYCNGFE